MGSRGVPADPDGRPAMPSSHFMPRQNSAVAGAPLLAAARLLRDPKTRSTEPAPVPARPDAPLLGRPGRAPSPREPSVVTGPVHTAVVVSALIAAVGGGLVRNSRDRRMSSQRRPPRGRSEPRTAPGEADAHVRQVLGAHQHLATVAQWLATAQVTIVSTPRRFLQPPPTQSVIRCPHPGRSRSLRFARAAVRLR